MKYYATVAASSSSVKKQNTVERIERRVLDSNPIMEAFGKKKTKKKQHKYLTLRALFTKPGANLHMQNPPKTCNFIAF